MRLLVRLEPNVPSEFIIPDRNSQACRPTRGESRFVVCVLFPRPFALKQPTSSTNSPCEQHPRSPRLAFASPADTTRSYEWVNPRRTRLPPGSSAGVVIHPCRPRKTIRSAIPFDASQSPPSTHCRAWKRDPRTSSHGHGDYDCIVMDPSMDLAAMRWAVGIVRRALCAVW